MALGTLGTPGMDIQVTLNSLDTKDIAALGIAILDMDTLGMDIREGTK